VHLPRSDTGVDCPYNQAFDQVVGTFDTSTRVPERTHDRGTHEDVGDGGCSEPGVHCPLSMGVSNVCKCGNKV
jgi:hypothetical protein